MESNMKEGEDKSHPASAGAGAVTIGLVGAVTGGAVAGPIGAAVGAGLGVVAGGIGGRALARSLDAQLEEDYWRENHPVQAFAGEGSYDDYSSAYRVGYEAFERLGAKSMRFEDVEEDIATAYHSHSAGLPWDKARVASRAAWNRMLNNKESNS